MARDTKKVNLTLNKKAVDDLDQLAAAGHRTRTQQVELLIAREWGRVNPAEYPGLYQNVYSLSGTQLPHAPEASDGYRPFRDR